MAEESNQEKTEEPTARRIKKAREEGDVARSRELAMATIMIATSALMLFMGGSMILSIAEILDGGLTIDRAHIFDVSTMPTHFLSAFVDGIIAVLPILLVTLVITLITPAFMGGWIFSGKAILPKSNRLNPMKGFARIFGIKSLIELLKAIAKFVVVAVIGYVVFIWDSDVFMGLSRLSLEAAFSEIGDLLAWSFVFMCLSLVLIAAIDVPFQAYQYNKKLRMTLQEVKDEFKEVEGRPEVKQAIRQKQRELSTRRMLDAVPSADVVVVNPDHYAVALSYDRDSEHAPLVVAKGVDQIAMQIKLRAADHDVHVIELPVLARAIYYTTELNEEIPEALYLAVAQVLSYVFALNDPHYAGEHLEQPSPEVPDDLIFDHDGKPMS